MSVPAEIAVFVECSAWTGAIPRAGAICRRAARAALEATREGRGLRGPAEVSLVLADDGRMRALNRDHRGRDEATNVLSFPSLAPGGPGRPAAKEASGPPLLLGDVVLGFETARAEAFAAGKPFAHHLAHLVVHGTLHLLGYDHAKAAEAERMERLEAEILARLGIPDPYGPAKRGTARARAATRIGADG